MQGFSEIFMQYMQKKHSFKAIPHKYCVRIRQPAIRHTAQKRYRRAEYIK